MINFNLFIVTLVHTSPSEFQRQGNRMLKKDIILKTCKVEETLNVPER